MRRHDNQVMMTGDGIESALNLEHTRMVVVSAHLKLHMAVMDSMFETLTEAMKVKGL